VGPVEKLEQIATHTKKQFHLKTLGFFGSYATGEAVEDSDIDILVEFSQPVGFEFFDLKEYLERELHRNVDLVTSAALKPQLKAAILQQVKYI